MPRAETPSEPLAPEAACPELGVCCSLDLPGPASAHPPRRPRSACGGTASGKLRPPCPAHGETNRLETPEKNKSWIREASTWSLPGTAIRYHLHQFRLMAVPSQTPAVVKQEQHPARGSAAALHPWRISTHAQTDAQRVCNGPCNTTRPRTCHAPRVTHVERAGPDPVTRQVSAGEVRGTTARQRPHSR